MEERPALHGHPSVLRVVPDPDPVVEVHPRRRGVPAGHDEVLRAALRAVPAPGHPGGRGVGDDLQLPALHGPPPLRGPGEDRPVADRGGRGPLREPGPGLLEGDAAPLPARRLRRVTAHVHPLGGRLHQRVPSGQREHHDDRQRDPDRDAHEQRLSRGGGALVHPDGRDPRRGGGLREGAGHRGADRLSVGEAEVRPVRPARPPAPRRRGRRRRWVLPAYTAVVIAYLFLPIAVMILFGFNDIRGRYNFNFQGFTLRWYRELLLEPELTESIVNSLVIAAVATVLATILGTMIGLALTGYRFRGRSSTNLAIFLPLATPEVVLGASLLSLFVTLGLPRGFLTILIAHVMFDISYVVVTIKARTQGFNREWEEAAKDLGATPWVTFWKVTFPLIMPGVMAAAALAFALSVDDYVITSFNAGHVSTFPLWVFGASRRGVPPQVNVMGTILFVAGVALALVNVALQRRRT
ncbi:MAG: ABC transporter permease [Actinobacteria bacterium]|nr:ABC transporter permease [Actinomycetota bacterium]